MKKKGRKKKKTIVINAAPPPMFSDEDQKVVEKTLFKPLEPLAQFFSGKWWIAVWLIAIAEIIEDLLLLT